MLVAKNKAQSSNDSIIKVSTMASAQTLARVIILLWVIINAAMMTGLYIFSYMEVA